MAAIAEEPERAQLYERLTESVPANTDYQRKTARVIPVIIFVPMR